MRSLIADNLKKLFLEGKLQDSVALWGIGKQTSELLQELNQLQVKVSLIVDNFKFYLFYFKLFIIKISLYPLGYLRFKS